MGKGTLLSEREKGKILAYASCNIPKREISRRIRRSVTAITNFLNNSVDYGNQYKGRKPILDNRARRKLRNLASNQQISAKEIKNDLGTKASLTTIRRELKLMKIVHRKMKRSPKLTANHKLQRMEFCRSNMATNWKNIWFSDEKKWNLDGPDGYNYYWHDCRKERKNFFQTVSVVMGF